MRALGPGWTSYTNANFVNTVAFDHDGSLWAATSGGVVRWDLDDGAYTKYTTAAGLVDNQVEAVTVAPDGIVWFGTRGGVSRFDPTAGSTTEHTNEAWTSYTTEDGLLDNNVLSVAVAPDGAIWFGHGSREGGASRFDPAAPEEAELWTTYTREDGLTGGSVRAIAATPDGALWFGTHDSYGTGGGGVSRFDGETWTTYTMADGLAYEHVFSIAMTPDGILWFGTWRGASRFDPGEVETWVTFREEVGLDRVDAIAVAPDGAIWFGTGTYPGVGWGVLQLDGEVWTAYTKEHGLIDSRVHSIAVAPDGSVCFGTESGISCFDGTAWTSYITDDVLADNYIQAITAASDGTLWFTSDNGVSQFDGRSWVTYRETDGLGDDFVWSITAAPDGSIWCNHIVFFWPDGCPAWGVSRFDGETWAHYTENNGLVDNCIVSIAVSPDGTIWFASEGGGISHFDPAAAEGETWTSYTVVNYIDSAFVAPDGALWIATWDDVRRFDGENWTTYEPWISSVSGSITHTVWPMPIAATPDGALWFAAYDEREIAGVARFGPASAEHGEAVSWTAYMTDTLANNDVESVVFAPDGALWLGTDGGGVFHFNGTTWRAYTEEDGLASNSVWRIVEAPNGGVWISYGACMGVSRFVPALGSESAEQGEAGRWITYTTADGLVDNCVFDITAAADGALWFATGGGISRYMLPD
jgi:ligand-binding sensor domain-containing protein